jgi:hypothetical protein
MYYLLFVTPNLGLIKNYVKYKIIDIPKYIRSYLLYAYIFGFLKIFSNYNVIYRVIIYERWLMFTFKIIRDIINDTYNINREKYILKYKLNYIDE